MSYTICNVLDLGPAYTGVTLNAQLYGSSNSTVGSAITTGFYERAGASGLYTFVLSIPDAHVGWCDVYVNGASSNILATLPINPAELENADVKTSTRSTYAGGAVASVTGNVGGNVVGSVGSVAGAVASVTAGVTVTTNNDKTGYALTVTPPTAAQIDTQLSGTHGAGGWTTATGFATPTNITAGTITTVTNLTNAPTAGDLTATMKASVTTAATAATPTAAAVTGNVGGNVTGSIGSLATQAKADVNAEVDTALADVGVTTTVTGRIDAAISTRLATAGYTASPTAVQNRQEMDSNSTKLANLDATVSSRLPTSSYIAPTTPPTATDIRTEMDTNSTKLANLDAAVSSRLATSGYTTPPTVSAIRGEIDSNSTKLDATVSSRASQSSLSALNNLSSTQTQAAAAAALAAYDAATGTDVATLATGVVIDAATMRAIADELLKRSVSNVEASASTHSLAELILGTFESAAPSTTWTIYRTDHSTVFNTRTLTTDADADPVTGVN